MKPLLDQARDRLSQRLGQEIAVVEVVAEIAERTTFLSTIEGRPAVVKIDTAAYRGNRETIALRAVGESR